MSHGYEEGVTRTELGDEIPCEVNKLSFRLLQTNLSFMPSGRAAEWTNSSMCLATQAPPSSTFSSKTISPWHNTLPIPCEANREAAWTIDQGAELVLGNP